MSTIVHYGLYCVGGESAGGWDIFLCRIMSDVYFSGCFSFVAQVPTRGQT